MTRTFKLLASDHVLNEVYNKLPRIAQSSSASEQRLRALFDESYLPLITFVSVPIDAFADEQTTAVTHATDVPTAVLAKLIAPCIVLSGDKHLRNPGIAPDEWREVARAGVDIAESEAVITSVGILGYGASAGMLKGVRALARLLEAPTFQIAALIAGVAYLIGDTPSGRQYLTRLRPAFKVVGTFLGDAYIKGGEGERLIEPVVVARLDPEDALASLASILARADSPLLVHEIKESFDSRRQDSLTVPEIRRLLEGCPLFVKASSHRWQLGQQLSAPIIASREPAKDERHVPASRPKGRPGEDRPRHVTSSAPSNIHLDKGQL